MNFESDSLAARRRKVVFYGRVSTEMEAQIAALKNQIIWYQQLAERHPEWTVVTMYEDEGISGRSINNRPGFMKMLTDAKKRKKNSTTHFCSACWLATERGVFFPIKKPGTAMPI